MAKIQCANPEVVVRRAFFLAWQACGGAFNMGALQDRGPGMTEEEVWEQVYEKKDYPGGGFFSPNRPGDVYGDYVFGRMMKLGLKWDETSVEVRDNQPRPDYQAWCKTYPTYEALVQKAIESLAAPPVQVPDTAETVDQSSQS